LVELKAVESKLTIERAFAADSVDSTVMGDWEDVQVDLGLIPARRSPRPKPPLFVEFEKMLSQGLTPPHEEPIIAERQAARERQAKRRTKAKAKRKRLKKSPRKNR